LVRGFDAVFWIDFRDEALQDSDLADAAHRAVGTRIVAEMEGGPKNLLVCDVML